MIIDTYIDGRKPRKDGSMSVKIRIQSRNEKTIISTGLYTKVEFSGMQFPNIERNARAKSQRLSYIIAQIDDICYHNPKASIADLKKIIERDVFGKEEKEYTDTLWFYCEKYGAQMKPSTAKIYQLAGDRVKEFDKRAKLADIDRRWLERYESYLRTKRGLTVNGIAQKMRCIRTVLNWCRDEGLTTNYPFRGHNGYKIREEETIPNALTAQEFANLRDYPCEPWQKIYVDMFCLSTYLAGVNVGDLLLCKGLTNGKFVFVRRKTDKSNSSVVRKIELPVCLEAMEIIERYKGENYLLSIMDNMTDYHTFTQHWNKALKKIGPSRVVPDKLGKMRKIEREPLFPSLTTYSARYTFASIAANDLDISETTIGKCLGHAWASGKHVTSRYISHDQKRIDDTVMRVAEYLGTFKGEY